MNLRETTQLLGWNREKVEIAIVEGIKKPRTNEVIRLSATPQRADYDIKEDDVDSFLAAFEAEEPGRYPPIFVRLRRTRCSS